MTVLRKIFYVVVFQAVIYLGLFMFFPGVETLRNSDSMMNFACFAFVGILSFAGVRYFAPQAGYWLLGIPVMWGFIMYNTPEQLYGIGDAVENIIPTQVEALLFSLGIFAIQCVIALSLYIYDCVKKRMNNDFF